MQRASAARTDAVPLTVAGFAGAEATAAPAHRVEKKLVLILASFFDERGGRWIDDFCQRSDFQFRKVANTARQISWHQRGNTTPPREWLEHAKYVKRALRARPDCIITAFPQLAVVTAALLLLTNRRAPRLIAWNFNLGALPGGWKRWLARCVLRRVDRFIVHASGEVRDYVEWLGVSEEKVQFIPLNKGRIERAASSPIEVPYIVSMGSAHRDYSTLVRAVRGLSIKTVIISKKHIVDELPDDPDLIKLHGLSEEQCNQILSAAAINVVPIADTRTACGQVTFTTSMRLGIPTIVSRCVGSVDYVRHEETGLLVPPGDVAALRSAISTLWNDAELAQRIGTAGRNHADRYYSDEAAGRYLAQQIDAVLGISMLPTEDVVTAGLE